jgi:3-hydroxyacyl-CoA dehydrogenase
MRILSAALKLYVNDVADVESIYKTWMITMGITMGPFGLMDIIGLETIYNVNLLAAHKKGEQELFDRAAYIKKHFIDKGKIGIKNGEGFYPERYECLAVRVPLYLIRYGKFALFSSAFN